MNIGISILAALLGAAFVSVFFFIWENRKLANANDKSVNMLEKATSKKDKILDEARKEADSILKTSKKEYENFLDKVEKQEAKLIEREGKIEEKFDKVSKKQEILLKQEEELNNVKHKLLDKEEELNSKISEISKLTEKEAREIFLDEISKKYESDALSIIAKHKKSVEKKKVEETREIILKSIQQYAGDVTSEVTTTLIPIPSEDIKGKLIGKEGRNITTFEKVAGVSLIIDDTPDSVFISGFDLFRRYVAKKSLEKLIEDGRIQPARIEEVFAQTHEEAELLLMELGNQILGELNITSLPEEIVPIIGKLRFRTSYGQNILKHSKEVALIAEHLARELGADPQLCKIGGLLHDLGKALDQDIEGTHPEIGGKVARKHGLNSKLVDMIENHHGEQGSISLEAAIVQVADAISSVRPGARRQAIEDYFQRIKEMESLVQSFSGVSKAFAISAGREIRVFVDAITVSDLQAQEMAKKIADEIQEKLSYPGEVKVNLIRESRVIQYAK
ncbi:MAG: ribonuclease Y [Candidatus Gracilibacteria bacterium]|nr:ribonuclease Y [Candidatus Gracilibacteria bacterium]